MRILHIRSSEFFGGPERAILGQCLTLPAKRIATASFVRGDAGNEFLKRCRQSKIDTYAIKESFPGDLRVVGQIKELMQEFDIAITHDYKANFYTYYAGKKSGFKHLSYFRGRTAEDFKVKIYNAIDWRILRKIKKILVVSDYSKKLLVSKGIAEENVEIVFNAIICPDSPIYRKVPDDSSPIIIIAAGRLSFEKGYDILLRALSQIKSEVPRFKMKIYGDGPDNEKLNGMIRNLQLSERVELCGFIDDVIPELEKADLMVLPSRSEGMPNILLESWSRSLGVISTAVGAVPDMMEHEKSGLLVKPEDTDDLAINIRFGLNNIDKIIDYGIEGYKIVKERYSYSAQAELLMGIYKKFLNAG